ncbi:cold shock domain-containing protein [Klebsiella michiganensis]|uniref:cold shock domain-containing protein n=1 Tax=Klebsiella michiganensis TaxID=1134687 RepID=UPI0025707410|nr:cold shock domain-containing protein [Klebsiella michiganensis]WJD77324.1 cold shock domain-containing protein [Klebsiella michiganensis]
MADKHNGRIVVLRENFGFITADSGKVKIYFSRSELSGNYNFSIGDKVSYDLGTNSKGPCAKEITPFIFNAEIAELNTGKVSVVAQALLARDKRQYDQAERLFKKAMELSPSQQVILSFAAMEKNRGRKKEAMDIYREGIKKFTNRKLFEDAAILATSLGIFSEARQLLTKALQLAKPGTEGGLFLLLGRNAFKENTRASLKESITYFERAIKTLSTDSFSKSDLISFNIAKLKDQHHRGNLAFNFFNGDGFKIIDVELLDLSTQSVDLIVEIQDKELTESFGVESKILVRAYFKSQVSLSDIDVFTDRISTVSLEKGTDEQLGLIITASVPEDLKRVLFGRIENKNKLYPAIIPLSQELIETEEPKIALNEVFGQWLYRRDLFNVNFPVVGRRFFGRNRDLDEIKDAIYNSTPVGLFGLRKVGKTSLLKELARRTAESGDIYIYIDLLRIPSDIKDFRWIYWRLSSELHKACSHHTLFNIERWRLGGKYESYLDIPLDFPVATAFDADLTFILKKIEHLQVDVKPKLVFLMDEIERLLPNGQGKEGLNGYFDFFSYFRGVSQESNLLTLVVTGANAGISEVSQFEDRDNPVFNFFKEVYLRLLPSQDCNAMLTSLGRGMGVRFSKGSIPRIVNLTGGHPFFSRQLCSFIAENYKERPLMITEKIIDKCIDQYILFCDKDMREIFERLSRDYPIERDFCLQLANNSGSGKISSEIVNVDSSGTTLRHLVGYQLIEITGDYATFTMGLLNLWLKSKIGAFK